MTAQYAENPTHTKQSVAPVSIDTITIGGPGGEREYVSLNTYSALLAQVADLTKSNSQLADLGTKYIRQIAKYEKSLSTPMPVKIKKTIEDASGNKYLDLIIDWFEGAENISPNQMVQVVIEGIVPENRQITSAARFTVNENMTVTDNTTGLMWDKNTNPQIAVGRKDEKTYYRDALNAIAKLNEDNYRGYNDWRLPTILELKGLIDYSGQIKTGFPSGHPFQNICDSYWSKTKVPNKNNCLYALNSSFQAVENPYSFENGVWPVRG